MELLIVTLAVAALGLVGQFSDALYRRITGRQLSF